MAFQLKTLRHQISVATQAAVNLVDLSTHAAMEMMVVLFAGNFVAGRFARKLHRHQPFFIHKRTDGAVHRGDTQAFHLALGHPADLFRRERAFGLFKDLADRSTLTGIAYGGWHGRFLHSVKEPIYS